ncbi:MAG TPA: hypothetical protein VLT59_03855 [Steroidobacteraceae bacterium]|nr:hypothetical protein [Steroidobacteraceae bacterium]
MTNELADPVIALERDDASAAPALPRTRRLPGIGDSSAVAMQTRRDRLREAGHSTDQIAGLAPEIDPERLHGSIEGYVGFARVPLGVAGPLRVIGTDATGEFFVPLATSEGTLVASFQHAFNVINRCGGVRAHCTQEAVGRAPCFELNDVFEAARFAAWLESARPALEQIVAQGSRYCRLLELRCSVVGNVVYVLLEFATGDAAGQNMVTSAAHAVCAHVIASSPVAPRKWLVESVLSGDKRASPMAFRRARGRNVSAEVVLQARQVRRYWRADVADMVRAWQHATGGAIQTGAVGLQGNVANALAALFVACGQDIACIAEACTALTRVEATSEGDVYFSVTLPNLIVGTVGGGTFLPTAQECLAMLDCVGSGKARKFAEIVAAVALAGEIAIVGAMASGAFAGAHAAASDKARLRTAE